MWKLYIFLKDLLWSNRILFGLWKINHNTCIILFSLFSIGSNKWNYWYILKILSIYQGWQFQSDRRIEYSEDMLKGHKSQLTRVTAFQSIRPAHNEFVQLNSDYRQCINWMLIAWYTVHVGKINRKFYIIKISRTTCRSDYFPSYCHIVNFEFTGWV